MNGTLDIAVPPLFISHVLFDKRCLDASPRWQAAGLYEEDSMKKANVLILANAIFLLLLSTGCGKSGDSASTAAIDSSKLQLFEPLPEVMPSKTNAITEEKVTLGRMLFYETRLSKSQQISCNSCHKLTDYGVDGQPTSDGHKGQKGDRNSPTVYNAASHFVQFWDGRAADVEEQAKGPVMNPVEMAMPATAQVEAVLKSMPEYVEAFKKAFPEDKEPVTYENMARAIGAFERKLVTPSRWDKMLRGDLNALTAEERMGFNAYMEAGCANCHVGTQLGGNAYQKLGVAKPWPDAADPGRAKVTNNDADKLVFKVPSLRNIAKTGPYYHDGKVATLEEAINAMADYQLGKKLSDTQIKSIATFLNSLTGELPAEYIKEPALPKSTDKTPKAEMD
jgi:cytochrome c peroxidase